MYGGEHNGGTIYTIQSDGSNFKKLYDFPTSGGYYPAANLIATEDPATDTQAVSRMAVAEPVYAYPNPTVNNFMIQNRTNENANIEITNFSGAIVYKGTLDKTALQIGDDLPKGIYIMKVQSTDGVTMHRLVKK
jgi:hypothetical protein